jgi:hypothetical protein
MITVQTIVDILNELLNKGNLLERKVNNLVAFKDTSINGVSFYVLDKKYFISTWEDISENKYYAHISTEVSKFSINITELEYLLIRSKIIEILNKVDEESENEINNLIDNL